MKTNSILRALLAALVLSVAMPSQPATAQLQTTPLPRPLEREGLGVGEASALLAKYQQAEGVTAHSGAGPDFSYTTLHLDDAAPPAVYDSLRADLAALLAAAHFQSADPQQALDIRANDAATLRHLLRIFRAFRVYLLPAGDFLSEAIIVEDYTRLSPDSPALSLTFCHGLFTPSTLRRAFRFDFTTTEAAASE